MAKVRLKNIRKNPRRPLVINLDRDTGGVVIDRRRLEESRQGERRVRMERVVIPDSLRIPFNGVSAPVDESVLEHPAVKAAIKAKIIAPIAERPSVAERRAAKAAARAAAAKGAKPRRKRASASEADEETATKGTSTKSESSKGRS